MCIRDRVSGVDQLTTGSKTLSEGAHTLAAGMVQFNEEGINKNLDAYNGDLKPFTDKLQAVICLLYTSYKRLGYGAAPVEGAELQTVLDLVKNSAEEQN